MNKFDKIRILAFQNGVPVGYIKSMSYKNNSFMLTKDKAYAKTYSTQDGAMRDIDYATRFGYDKGYIFSMD